MVTVEGIFRSIALWNALIVGGTATCVAVAFVWAEQGRIAWAVLVGGWLVVVSAALSCLFSKVRGGALAGLNYVIKMVLLMGVVFLVEAWTNLEREALFITIFFGIIVSLGIDSWVILRQAGPDFDVSEGKD